MAVVRFSDRPPSEHEPPREPSEEDFFEKYLRRFQDPPSFAEPFELKELPRLPSFRTRHDPEEVLPELVPGATAHQTQAPVVEPDDDVARANREKDTIYPFANLDLPLPAAAQLSGLPGGLGKKHRRGEMEAMVPNERQSMMSESEYGPAPLVETPPDQEPQEPPMHVEKHLPPPPPPVLLQTDMFQETLDLPLGVSHLQETTMRTQPVLTEHNLFEEEEPIPQQGWCGLWSFNCKEGKCSAAKKADTCVRCKKALESFLDHRCPNCGTAVCVKCVNKFPVNWFRCKTCGDQEANQQILRNNLWIIDAYNSTTKAFKSLGKSFASFSTWLPCRNQETAQSLKDSTVTQLRGGQAPQDSVIPADRTHLPSSFSRQVPYQLPKELPKRKKPYRPGSMPLPPPPPPPPHGPCELPSLLGRISPIAPMNYYESDPFKTLMPGEMGH